MVTSTTALPAATAVLIREIRDPLCHITLACDMIDSIGLDSEQKKYLQMVKSAAQRISTQLNMLLQDETGSEHSHGDNGEWDT